VCAIAISFTAWIMQLAYSTFVLCTALTKACRIYCTFCFVYSAHKSLSNLLYILFCEQRSQKPVEFTIHFVLCTALTKPVEFTVHFVLCTALIKACQNYCTYCFVYSAHKSLSNLLYILFCVQRSQKPVEFTVHFVLCTALTKACRISVCPLFL
jgi:hypothetical protein